MRRLRYHPTSAALLCLLMAAAQMPGASAAENTTIPDSKKVLPGPKPAVERVVTDPATGNPQLITFMPNGPVQDGAGATEKAMDLLLRHPSVFGLVDPARELQPLGNRPDPMGGEQAIFHQFYRGIPVFGTMLRIHFDGRGAVSTVNGTVVSDIDLDPVPRIDGHVAENAAARLVTKQTGHRQEDLTVHPATLLVYREGLVRGRPGENHLAWEIEVQAAANLHEVLYLDAHNGRLLDQRSMIHHLQRVVHLGHMPRPIWSEGDPIPYDSGSPSKDAEVNELIEATGDTHRLFANMTNSQYLSFDGLDATMHSVYDSTSIDCPNAVESGGVTAYCVGMVSDDVAAHEWTHAYTEWTHGLIYQWQPGALNEAYSDIFGELVDQLNGRGSDFPGGPRPDLDCSASGGNPPPNLQIETPPEVAGPYPVGGAVFNPLAPWTVSATVELAEDGTGVPSDGCEPMTGFTPGSIALIDRGSCFFRDKVQNAQTVGAVGAIVVNHEGDDVLQMGGDLPRLDIPAVFLGKGDGDLLKSVLDSGVTATLNLDGDYSDSVRWIIGEDTGALGAIRDMWSPTCFGDPGRVGSVNYACGQGDNGGVHSNSGIPNHAFALLVDGGTYNGQTVGSIGATKAARVFWRAMAGYQTPVTDFQNHADLLEVSCQDLIGEQLYDLQTGAPSTERITDLDCDQVAAAMTAVEMRTTPEQCEFEPLLDPDAPLPPGNMLVFEETFDDDFIGRWSVDNSGIFPEYVPRDWVWTEDVPPGGAGGAIFAIDSVLIGDCRAGSDDQSGVMEIASPLIEIPRGTSAPILVFDHWVATEPSWDGGNLKISVNGGSFVQIPTSMFLFNPYNTHINTDNTNPLAGESAFTGTDEGSLSGSWGQSQIDLASIADPGDHIRIRFDLGVDGCNGAEGWYVDNVRIVVATSTPRSSGGRVAP